MRRAVILFVVQQRRSSPGYTGRRYGRLRSSFQASSRPTKSAWVRGWEGGAEVFASKVRRQGRARCSIASIPSTCGSSSPRPEPPRRPPKPSTTAVGWLSQRGGRAGTSQTGRSQGHAGQTGRRSKAQEIEVARERLNVAKAGLEFAESEHARLLKLREEAQAAPTEVDQAVRA